MKIKCSICQTSFEWTRPASSHGGARTPKICSNPECKRTRAHKSYLKWKAAHPGKVKQYWQKQALKKKQDKSFEYFCKDTPKPVKKHRCIYPVANNKQCGKITGNNGANHLYCDFHHSEISERCSSEYPEFIYETNDIENITLTLTGG